MGTQAWRRETFLASLPARERVQLADLGVPRNLGPGDVLIHEGGRDRGVYVVLSGAAKVTASVGDGRSVLIDVLAEGDLVGEFAVIDAGQRSATVTVAVPVTVRAIGVAEFLRFLDGSPGASREFTRAIAAKARRATRHQLTLNVGAPVRRLAIVLTELAERCSSRCQEGVRLGVPLSQAEIADYAGMSAPHLQRAFSALRREKVVFTSHRTQIITDLPRLREIGGLGACPAPAAVTLRAQGRE